MSTEKEKSSKTVQEFQFHPKPTGTKWETFQRSIYDPEKRSFLGKDFTSWCKLIGFYSLFYTALAIFWAGYMNIYMRNFNDKAPKWQLDEGLIGSSPGLGFRPLPDDAMDSSLIWYDLKRPETRRKWIELVDEYLGQYGTDQVGKNCQECDHNTTLVEGNVCTVDLAHFGPCSRDNSYGFGSSSPCFFLKLNRIFGWVPDFYTEGTDEMPGDLKNLIAEASGEDRRNVWVSCRDQKAQDGKNVVGFSYYPSRGFPGYYFPFKNDENYQSPLIAVQVKNVTENEIANIECRAWAKNIIYDGRDSYRAGSVHLQILVENKE